MSCALLCLCLLLATPPAGAPAATQPSAQSPLDPAIVADLKALVTEFANGRAEARATAALAIQLTPEEALPVLEDAWQHTAMSPQLHDSLGKMLGDQKIARARLNQRERTTRRWTARTTIDAYDAIGHHDPRWDAPARQVLALFNKPGLTLDDITQLRAAAHDCISVGCEDPLVLFLAARELELGQAIPANEARDLCIKAAQGLLVSHYSASRQCLALEHAAALSLPPPPPPIIPGEAMKPRAPIPALSPAQARDVQHMLDAALDRLPAATQEQDIPPDQIVDLALALITDQALLVKDKQGAFDRVSDVLTKAMPKSATPLVVRGIFLSGFAHNVTSDSTDPKSVAAGTKLYRQRLGEASVALEKAFDLDPTDDRGPCAMMLVELSRASLIPKIEPWFLRAIHANPDSYRACVCRLLYIDPRWAGRDGVELMWDFGHACARSWNYRAGIPLILPLIHRELARSVAYSDGQRYSPAYMRRPVVWKDAQYIYSQALQRQPESAYLHTAYAQYAAWCEHWDIADEELRLLGDRVDTSCFADAGELDAFRKQVASGAGRGGDTRHKQWSPEGH